MIDTNNNIVYCSDTEFDDSEERLAPIVEVEDACGLSRSKSDAAIKLNLPPHLQNMETCQDSESKAAYIFKCKNQT